MKKPYLILVLLCSLFLLSCSDETTDSDELASDATIFQEFIINYNQETSSLYAEAELTMRRAQYKNSSHWLRFEYYDFIRLVGGDRLNFHILDTQISSYVLRPTQLVEKRKQVFWGSKTVPYYRLEADITMANIQNKSMAFNYYNANDSRTYTYATELLVPTLEETEISSGDVLDVSNNDRLTLTFSDDIKKFDYVNLEFVNANGNSFFFSVNVFFSNQFIIQAMDLRNQAQNQSYTIKEKRRRRLGNLNIESNMEKEIPLILAGTQSYKLNISAVRKVEEEVVASGRELNIRLNQNIKMSEQTIKIGF